MLVKMPDLCPSRHRYYHLTYSVLQFTVRRQSSLCTSLKISATFTGRLNKPGSIARYRLGNVSCVPSVVSLCLILLPHSFVERRRTKREHILYASTNSNFFDKDRKEHCSVIKFIGC